MLRDFAGQFVGVYGGQIVDADIDDHQLCKRMEARYPDISSYQIREITKDGKVLEYLEDIIEKAKDHPIPSLPKTGKVRKKLPEPVEINDEDRLDRN